jgi:tetratricopeptide (TPR) repeat protein
MILDYTLGGIAIIGSGVIATILIRKFPKLSAINTDAIASVREEKMKNDLIERRLERKLGGIHAMTLGRVGGGVLKLRFLARRVYWKLRQVEREYRQKARLQLSPAQRAELQRKVALLVEDSKIALSEGRHTEAEHRCIEAIALEPKSLSIYQVLGDVYRESKDFVHAQEVYAHAIELSRRKYRIKSMIKSRATGAQEYGGQTTEIAELFFDQSLALKQLDRVPDAVKSCEEATRLIPNNPKYLHALFDLAVEVKQKALAISTLDKLRSSNPDNQRLEELEAQLKTI